MYIITVDDEVLYSPNLANEGYAVLEPQITTELNKSGSLEFTLPSNNVKYNDIHKLKSIIKVYDNDEEIFRGRVLHDEKDFYKHKKVYCEGELSFLLDSIQRPYDHKGTVDALFKQYINNHNSQVEEAKQFTVGQITVTDKNNYVAYSSTLYPNTWNEIAEKLVNTHGGYIRARFENGIRYIDYIEDYESTSEQIIEFGINMLDISEYISADEVFTILIPLGASTDDVRLTIKSVNSNKDYLQDDAAIALFGKITRIQEWDDVTTASALKTKGEAFLKEGIEMAVTLTMKAVDLHLLDVDTARIKVGDYVRVVSLPHNIDKLFQCSGIKLDLVNPESSEYTFGVMLKTMTDSQVNGNSQFIIRK